MLVRTAPGTDAVRPPATMTGNSGARGRMLEAGLEPAPEAEGEAYVVRAAAFTLRERSALTEEAGV